MLRKFFQTVPKYAFAALVFFIGLGSLAFWMLKKKVEAPTPSAASAPAIAEKSVDNSAKVARIESGFGSLVLADNDLYDGESGELLFSKWLKHGMPQKLFWQAESKTVLAQYERGIVRYKPDGKVDAELPNLPAAAVADDYKWAVFSRGGDIYHANIDWPNLKLGPERKVTSTGLFNDHNFAGSILLGTDKTLLVRNLNQLIRVDLESGTHQPIRLPVDALGKRRSSNQKSVVGIQNGEFYCYDVDANTSKSIPVGRVAFNDCQWLDNNRCVVLGGGTAVVLYDREKNTLTPIVTLPQACNRIGDLSPDGRFVFCGAHGKVLMVDVREKTAVSASGGAGLRWISGDSYVLSRELPDSELRGIWLQKIGDAEQRISPEPYLVGNLGPMLLEMKPEGTYLFATKSGLSRMKPDGSEVVGFAKSLSSVRQALVFMQWPL